MNDPRRLLVLGAGRHQVGLIRRAEQRGVETIAMDYYPDAPGKRYASHTSDASSLDVEQAVRLGRRYSIDGVITSGTDMPVVTMARVADALDLPCYLQPEAAELATNKTLMTQALTAAGARRPHSTEVRDADIGIQEDMRFPIVVKPVDSQGQRATTRVDEPSKAVSAIAAAIEESRARAAIVEEFVDGYEVTASAWVSDGRLDIWMVTDRITYNRPPAIGIAFQHVYPSVHGRHAMPEIQRQLGAVVRAYGMKHGPLYVQLLVSGHDVWVVEAAARVGGGHETSLLSHTSKIDVTDDLIDLALTGTARTTDVGFDGSGAGNHGLVNFLLADAGTVAECRGFEALIDDSSIVEGDFYITPGSEAPGMINSLGRVGYFLVEAPDRSNLMRLAEDAYRALSVRDRDGRELLFWPEHHVRGR